MKPLRLYCVAVFFLVFGGVAAIAEPKPVDLPPLDHENAQLVVLGPDGSRTIYTPAELEEFPTFEIKTATPWRDEPAVFAGVLLSDLLAHHNLQRGARLLVTAENDFSVTFDPSAQSAAPILIATRVNGAPHSRRERGPIQFVIEDEDLVSSDALNESHLVWMAARIEVAQ